MKNLLGLVHLHKDLILCPMLKKNRKAFIRKQNTKYILNHFKNPTHKAV